MVQEASAAPAAPAETVAGWREVSLRPRGAAAADLLDLPQNPVPRGATVTVIEAGDGVRIRTARFAAAPGTTGRGTVCLFQGRGEQVEKYFAVIRRLQRRGFTVATLDWRGQGGSARLVRDHRLGHVADFRHYARDLEAFRRQIALPDCPPPFFGLAHSMGGLVLLSAAANLAPWMSRLVLASPFLGFGDAPLGRRGIAVAATVLGLVGLGRSGLPKPLRRYATVRAFDGNPLTGDPERFAVMTDIAAARPDLSVGPPTIAWLGAAARAIRFVEDDRFPPTVRVPLLFVNAGADRVVSTLAVETMARRVRGAAYVLVPGARHELMMEEEVFSAQFWAAFDAFVPGGGPP